MAFERVLQLKKIVEMNDMISVMIKFEKHLDFSLDFLNTEDYLYGLHCYGYVNKNSEVKKIIYD
jgi:hypothetical protein